MSPRSDAYPNGVGRSHHNPPTVRVLIEQAIARGETDLVIAEQHDVTIQNVRAVRRALDEIAQGDAFVLSEPHARRDYCPRGHAMTQQNTYQRPNGNRECRRCKKARDINRRRAA